jgi:Putative zinc-finger
VPDHPDHEQLAAFQAGDGDRRQRTSVEAHLAGCPSCAEVVASVEQARGRLALLEEPALPPGLHDRLAAAVAADAAQQAAADIPPSRRRRQANADQEILAPTPWYRRPVAWGAAAALLLAALVVPFLDRSGTLTTANNDTGDAGGATEAAGGDLGQLPQLPVVRIPGEVSAATVKARLAADGRVKAALDAATAGAPGGQALAPGASKAPDYGTDEAARSSAPAPQAAPALLEACHVAATGDADPASRPLTPAFFVEGAYKGREATILVTTSARPAGRVDLWVFPRDDCTSPPLATERVR